MRFQMIDPASATGKAKRLLDGVQAKLGMTPNMIKAMANSPAVLEGYLNFSTALSSGLLDGKLREQVALAVSQHNHCGYCLAAHTAIGGAAGLTPAQIQASRACKSADARTGAALAFVQELVSQHGAVSPATFQRVTEAGWSEGEIAEMLGHAVLTIFTNYFNLTAQTEVDFPAVEMEVMAA